MFKKRARIVFVFAASIALSACELITPNNWLELDAPAAGGESALAAGNAGEAIAFTDISLGYYSQFKKAGMKAIRSEDEWAAAQTQFQSAPNSLPAIDFGKDMLIIAAMGQRNTGGYQIKITKITASEESLVIHYQTRTPAASDFVTQALTNPYHIIRLPRTEAPLTPRRHGR